MDEAAITPTARVEAERAIADELDAHTALGQRCKCGFTVEQPALGTMVPATGGRAMYVSLTATQHRAHVASVLADLMAERQAEAWAAGYRKGADDHYQCGDTCKVSTEAPNPYRPDPKDTRDE